MTQTIHILQVLGVVLALIAIDFIVGVLTNLKTFSIQKFPAQLANFVLPYFVPLAVLGASVIFAPLLNLAGATGGTAAAFYVMAAGVALKALADIGSKVGVSFSTVPSQTLQRLLPQPRLEGASAMTVDVTEFEAESRGNLGGKCWWRLLELTPEQRAKLDEALWRRPDITSAAICRVLRQWGFSVSGIAVRRHRTATCACDRQ